MTTDARRAELNVYQREQLRRRLAAYLRVPTVHDVDTDLVNLVDDIASEAESRGIAKGLEMAADKMTVANFWKYGPDIESIVTRARHLIWSLSQSTTKGQGR